VKRTTVKLPERLDSRLRHEAERRAITISELTREAIEAYLNAGGRRGIAGGKSWRSGQTDVSERIEEILRGEIGHSASA
jgi:hypothetical protein